VLRAICYVRQFAYLTALVDMRQFAYLTVAADMRQFVVLEHHAVLQRDHWEQLAAFLTARHAMLLPTTLAEQHGQI
jgi:hypothetical protein